MLPETRQRARLAMTGIVGLPRSERARALEACFPKDGRSQQQLLSLLDLYDALGLSESHSASATRAPEENRDASSDGHFRPLLNIGSTCGPYRVIRRIGEGGMGQVFLAEDPRLARRVALKSLAGEWLEAPNARERLMREARAVAGLAHTNIATLYDVLEEAGRLLLVMEYVEGRTIADLLDGGPVPTPQALRIVGQIADAIGYAHDRGVIHCDLKPANIQVADNGVAKVLDFGLARVRYAEGESAGAQMPGTSALLGTPGYIAPERMMFGVLNASGDIYNIGIVLFEMVTGRRLFDRKLQPEQWFDLVNGQPVRTSAFVRDLPARLDAVIERALAAEPALRYPSAHELGRDLRGVLKSLDTASTAAPLPRVIDRPRHAEAPRSTDRRLALLAGVTLTTVSLLWLAGFITSGMYSMGLASADFDLDPPIMHLIWGVRSMIMPAAIGVFIMVALGLATAICRIPLRMGQRSTRWLGVCNRVQQRVASVGALPVGGTAAAVVVAELLVLGLLFWRFGPLLSGLSNFLQGSNPSDLSALSPSNVSEHRLYRQAFSIHVLLFAVAWFQLLKLRARRSTREAQLVVAAGLALTVVSFLLLVAPYRTLVHNRAEIVSFEGRRCYLVGHRLPDALLFCPTLPASWSRIVQADNPALARTGIRESIFKEAP